MGNKIVITGISIISSIGTGKDAFWDNLVKGVSGIKPVTTFDVSAFKSSLGGEITDFDAREYLGKKGIRHIDRTSLLVSSGSVLAMQDANIDKDTYAADELGIVIGSTYGSIDSISRFDMEALEEGPNYVNPMEFPNTVLNAPAARASIFCNATGLNSTISNGVTSGIDAIIYASDFLKMGRVKAVLAGGVFGLTYGIYLGASQAGLLAGSKNGSLEISAPFDKRRNGFILGECAAILALENIEDAERRGAKIYAEVKGYGTAFNPAKVLGNGDHIEDSKRATHIALEDASLSPGDISYVSACANSSITGDEREANVISHVFGERAKDLPVYAIKSMTGECLDGSGAMQAVASVLSINNEVIPPTINYESSDNCNFGNISTTCREMAVRNVLINSFSDTGNSSSLILSKN